MRPPSIDPNSQGSERTARCGETIIIDAMPAFHFMRLAAAVALLAALPADALAYIDPGTGSMLLQSLLAAIAAALVFGRTIWHKVRSVFQRDRRKDPPAKS